MGTRRKGRESALQILYQLEVLAGSRVKKNENTPKMTDLMQALSAAHVNQAVEAFFENFEASPAIFDYASSLVRGTLLNLNRVDGYITRHSDKWRLERMALVDRNVLRFSTYELLFSFDLPANVVIDEAIEVAKRFGSEKSAAFVNGVLDSIAADIRKTTSTNK
jgi:transcription antitermination protein NusB